MTTGFSNLFESILSNPSITPAEAKKKLAEVLISIVPKTAVKPINKLSREITRGLVDDGQTSLMVGNTKNVKNMITTLVTLTSENKNISLSGRLAFTPYDLEVEDAIATLWAAGNICFSPAIVSSLRSIIYTKRYE